MRILIVSLLLFATVTVLSIWYLSSDRSAPLRLPSTVQESTLFESDAVIAIDPDQFLATIGDRDIVFYSIDLETGRGVAHTPERAPIGINHIAAFAARHSIRFPASGPIVQFA